MSASERLLRHAGIVVGLEAEARIARGLGLPVEVGGGHEQGAKAAAERLIRRGVRGLISFGLAGGLHPDLRAGALVVPEVILSADEHWPTDPALAALLGPVGGALFGAGEVLTTAAQKQALHARTGAAAVDLESAAVAAASSRYALPFAVLRAICDPAHRSLPTAALVALSADGQIGLLRVLQTSLSHPAEMPLLLALARDALRARRALRAQVKAIR